MMDFLGVTDHGQERNGRFNDHAVIPGSLFAEFDVVGHAISAAETPVSQQDRFLVIFFEEIQEILIRAIHFIPNPATDLTETVENPTQFHAYTPAAFVTALAAELLFGTAFANWEKQFHRIAIHHIQHTGLFQQQVGQILIFAQLPQCVAAIWQAAKQLVKITLEPAVKGPKVPALQGKQDAYRHYFTWIQFGAWVFANLADTVIDMIENVNDNTFRSHDCAFLLASTTKSLALFMTISTRTTG